ncbi:GD10465 [Drosophila simulans]|uniref:GD10465 n=1 Tax=Drosophila simulans TaxID=7240 RepID=B4QE76_DROSI|nr:GD10465 [Drosophila simulans]
MNKRNESGLLPGSRHRSWLQSFLKLTESWKEPNSQKNEVEIKSDSTQLLFRKNNTLKDVSDRDGKQLVDEIVHGIFDKKQGTITLSESECSLQEDMQESLSMDPRLKLWYNTLENRAAVQAKIQRKLGRRPDEMLINVGSTVAPRDRGTVVRLLDLAGRMNPTTLVQKKPAVLSALITSKCKLLPELQETLPCAEQTGRADVEITGLTRATKQEILGRAYQRPEMPTPWQKSQMLENRIENESSDIKRVISFFPNLDRLEVVGGPVQQEFTDGEISRVERVSCDSIFSVSSTSQILPDEEQKEESPSRAEPDQGKTGAAVSRAAVKINGMLFVNSGKRIFLPEIANVFFECHPFQNVVKEVACVENVGGHVLTCQWCSVESKRAPKSTAQFHNFLMSQANFTVLPGEVHVCRALFRPRGCYLLKQRYELRISPNVIGSVRGIFLARLTGHCTPAPEYTNKLRRHQQLLTDRAKMKMTSDLNKYQASVVPLLHPPEVICPYERVLDEREVFNVENPGYKCERFDDLETLKSLYKALKKPREPAWDLRLQTVRKVILRLPESYTRKFYYEKLVKVQEELKLCRGIDSPTHVCPNDEGIRSMFIYLRGYSQLEIEIQIQMDKHTQDTCGTWMTVSCNCCRGIWLPLKQLRQSPLMAMMMKMKMKLLLSDKGIAAMETAVART